MKHSSHSFLCYLAGLWLVWLGSGLSVKAASPQLPKYEFRGAWISTINQTKYAAMTPAQMQDYFCALLDTLQSAGINVVLFQVRPQCDAWYRSSYEPWSEFITGKQGKHPGWDPLAFLVEECHKRLMDIHAWINPYRVKLTVKEDHFREPFIRRHRSWMVRYGRSLWLDPGLPECQDHIVKVVREIVHNYDIDGIHLDDYFYPYPVAGEAFPDQQSFAKYAKKQGYTSSQLADWRRNNVNTLVERLHQQINQEKPWVRFGISPFGIHRNLKQDPDGSRTNGLSNYDDLYADVLLWMREGWIDYCVPQLYWEIGHTRADYATLIDWWSEHVFRSAMYIGQDVARSMKPKQMQQKLSLSRATPNVQGNCFFPAYDLEKNLGGILDTLRLGVHAYPALVPTDKIGNEIAPEPIFGLDLRHDYRLGCHFYWNVVRSRKEEKRPYYFVIYRFRLGEDEDITDPRRIVGMTPYNFFVLPPHPTAGRWVYHVTAVNRLHRESPTERIVVEVK